MADFREYRVQRLYDLSPEAANTSLEIIQDCLLGHAFLPDITEHLSYACDFCNSSDVVRLWEEGLCNFPPSVTYDTIVYIFYILIFVFAMIGNTLIIYVVCTNFKMRTVTNYFIANLAAGDLSMALFCVPFSFFSTLILKYWPFGVIMCITVNYLQAVSVFVSAYSLVAISFDRYRAIVSPLRPRMSRFHAKVIILVIWILSVLTTLPVAIFSVLIQPPENFYEEFNRWVCTEDWGMSPVMQEVRAAYSLTLMLLQYLLPLVVLFFTYGRIGLVVWAKRMQIGETPARLDKIERSKVKILALSFIVVLAY
ncbi:unnamed protein product, partial [Meganyctiphanes norvegica]